MPFFNIWDQEYCYHQRRQSFSFTPQTVELTVEAATPEAAVAYAKYRAHMQFPVVAPTDEPEAFNNQQ